MPNVLHLSFLVTLVLLPTTDGWCYDWGSWGSCSRSCGGGTRTRRVTGSFLGCGDSKQTRGCNEFCYNGGRYTSGRCHCSTVATGRCCEHLDYCRPKPCQQRCTHTGSTYQCSCHTGYFLAKDGKTCYDIDECRQNTDHCSDMCTNTPGSYTCGCNERYQLAVDRHTCVDKNECSIHNGGCQHTCRNTQGSYSCECRPGFTSEDGNKTCTDIDECSSMTSGCDQDCTNIPGSYRCSCQRGYQLDTNLRSCKDIDECALDNGGCSHLCINEQGSSRCECRQGYRLTSNMKDCIDIDECSEDVSGCTQVCQNRIGGYVCKCKVGYILNSDGKKCDDVDDCVGISCRHGGSCIDGINSYTCLCSTGYKGVHCEYDKDECAGFLNGGCEDICLNTVGSFRCDCSDNRTLSADKYTCEGGDNNLSVFDEHSIVRNLLPRGCFTLPLTGCREGKDIHLLLSSTSPWYTLIENNNVAYTYGVVFVELNDLALPISITGLKVLRQPSTFQLISGALLYKENDGNILHYKKHTNCLEFDITPKYIHEFLYSTSFLRSFYKGLESVLPDWLTFSDNGTTVFDINGLKSEFINGKKINDDVCCRGAPVFDDHLYTVLKYSADIKMTLYGEEVTLPKSLNGHKACFIIDICHDYGGTMFLILPEGSRNVLDLLRPFQSLRESNGITIRPHGVGVSLKKNINVLRKHSAVQLWKGDEMFNYPLLPTSNLWIGGDIAVDNDIVNVRAKSDMFLSTPSIKEILYSVFFENWEAYIVLQLNAKLQIKFRMSGEHHILRLGNIGNAKIELFASLGGVTTARNWCGQDANPPGLFLSIVTDVNPFPILPIPSFLVDINTKLFVFFTTNPAQSVSSKDNIDILSDIMRLDTMIEEFINVTINSVSKYATLLTNESSILLQDLSNSAVSFKNLLKSSLQDINHLQLDRAVQNAVDIWHNGWSKLTEDIEKFIDSIEFNTRITRFNLSELIQYEANAIKGNLKKAIGHMTDQLMNIVNDFNGFGLRFQGALKIFGLEFAGFQLEFVYSIDKLGSCGKFKDAYNLLKDQKSVRVFGSLHGKFIQLCPFLRLDVGGGFGMACSIENPECVVQFHARAGLLGVKTYADVFIDRNNLRFYVEGDIWDVFKTVLHVSAGHGKGWKELHFIVNGKFVANGDSDGNFDDSYLQGIRKLISDLGNGANKRLSQVQSALSKAQCGLTKAQNWLTEKEAVVLGANKAFDSAISGLEYAKKKLEEAKGPFQNAIEKLNRAQKKVDNLCRIKTCSRVCIPGIKCRICHKKVWFVRIPYPCCHFTNCMISFPNPLCVAANLLCRGVRALAYIALEAAKLFVRIPMVALDIAKVALSAAEIVVDKSRIILDIAVGAMEIAKIGLDGAKDVLEISKLAIKSIEFVVRVGLKVFDMIIKYGLQSLIDVKNCGFEVELFTSDKSIFSVSCQVNAFNLGWKSVGFTINFKDPIQSLWQATKATVKMLTNAFEKALFGRRKREIFLDAISSTHRVLRALRNENITYNETDSTLNQTIDVTLDTVGYKDSLVAIDDVQTRISIFQEKCLVFTNVLAFFTEANDVLLDIVGNTVTMMNNVSRMEEQLNSFNISHIQGNISLENTGINPDIAMKDYNISAEDLQSVLEDTKHSIANDSLMLELSSASDVAKEFVSSQTENIAKFRFLDQWLIAMENTTTEYFKDEMCVSFLDCAHFAISEMYDLFYATNLPNKEESMATISIVEDMFLDLAGNISHDVRDIHNLTEEIALKLHHLDNMALFCSQAPTMLSPLSNETVTDGAAVHLICNATGKPAPTFWWFKDDILIHDQHGMILTINATWASNNTHFRCMAGNVVANRSSDTALLLVEDAEVDGAERGKSGDYHEKIITELQKKDTLVAIVGPVTVTVLVIVTVGTIVWRTKIRKRFRKSNANGSFASLNMVRPVSAAKPAFQADKLK